MIYFYAFLTLLLPILMTIFLLRKKHIEFKNLSDIGSYLQGVAAILLVAIGLIKTDEILKGIDDLKNSVNETKKLLDKTEGTLDRIEEISKQTYKRVLTLPIPPATPATSANQEKSNKAEEVQYWTEKLREIPEVKSPDSQVYIPNKTKMIQDLTTAGTGLEGQLKRAATLKSSIQVNKDLFPPQTDVTTDVKVHKNNDVDFIINQTHQP